MFYHYDNLKRAIGLLSVVLVLSSGFQQTGLCCYLAGSASTDSCNVAEEHCCSEHVCPHSPMRQGNSTPHESASQDECSDHLCCSCLGPCPCPPTCYCHQSPDPFELPRSAPEPTELLVLGSVCADVTMIGALHNEQLSRAAVIAVLDSSVKSAAQVCAQLCRFLT